MRARLTVAVLATTLFVSPASAAVFTVNSNSDGELPDCSIACTLRTAIKLANANPGADTIRFVIPGTPRINVLTPLPALIDAQTTIDGFSQPGSALGGPSTFSFNPVVKVHIKGPDGPDTAGPGLRVHGSDTVIGGVSISHFDTQLELRSGNNTVLGSLFGVAPDLRFDTPRNARGVLIATAVFPQSVANNSIGVGASTNLIAGVATGIEIDGVGAGETEAQANRIQGNFMGVEPSGVGALPLATGIRLRNATNVLVGTFSSNDGFSNRIGGLAGEGSRSIDIDGGDFISIYFNTLGGVDIFAHPVDTGIVVSGNATRVYAHENKLLHARYNGVDVIGNADRVFPNNTLMAIGGLPLDLGRDGVDANDALDADTGPNRRLNSPRFSVDGTGLVTGTLDAEPNRKYRIDFVSVACPPPGANAPHYAGAWNVFENPTPKPTTDASGHATFTAMPPPAGSNRCLGASAVDDATQQTSEVWTDGVRRGEVPQVSFERSQSIGIDPAFQQYAVQVVRWGGSGPSTVTVRAYGAFIATTPAIPAEGLELSWASGDYTPRTILVSSTLFPDTKVHHWTLEMYGSGLDQTIVAPYGTWQHVVGPAVEPEFDRGFGGANGGFED